MEQFGAILEIFMPLEQLGAEKRICIKTAQYAQLSHPCDGDGGPDGLPTVPTLAVARFYLFQIGKTNVQLWLNTQRLPLGTIRQYCIRPRQNF